MGKWSHQKNWGTFFSEIGQSGDFKSAINIFDRGRSHLAKKKKERNLPSKG